MTTLNNRFQKGLEMRERLAGGEGRMGISYTGRVISILGIFPQE